MRAADHQLAVDGFTGKYGSVREVVQVDFSIFRRSLLKFDFMTPNASVNLISAPHAAH
jgi:hypothetical protein